MQLPQFRARSVGVLASSAGLALAVAMPGAALARPHAHPQHGHAHRQRALFVATDGSDSNSCTRHRPCKTIGHAVDVARRGAVIAVAHGTYAEQVTLEKRLRLVGRHHPVIDATGRQNGIVLSGRGAAHSRVQGFVVENADQEGILATRTRHVTIRGNVVRHNDLGAASPNPTGECAPQGEVPGDCGEGLHLMSVTRSKVTANRVGGNAGGILLTDELGPTAHNVIARNRVLENPFDCGITIAGHNGGAVAAGTLKPHVGGIYHNVIYRNVSNRNGLRGEGAGILLATAGPGTAVYANLVKHNVANGNNLAGVTLHSHAPGDYLNRNRIVGNRLGDDNLGGDPDAGDTESTGIVIFSAVSPLSGIVVRGNRIRDVHFGIWTKNAPAIPANANRFSNVAVPLDQH